MRCTPKLAFLGGTVAFAAAATAVAVEATVTSERMPPGVHVDGVDVGGLTPADAGRLLARHSHTRAHQPVRVEGPQRAITTSGAALGAEALVAQALAAASTERLGPVRKLLSRRRERHVPLRFRIPRASVEALAATLGAVPAVDAKVVVDGRGIRVRAARDGLAVDIRALHEGLTELPRRLRVATVSTPAHVTTAAAEAAAARARRLVDRPRELLVGDASITLSTSDLRRALRVRRAEHGFAIGFDADVLRPFLPRARPARNAEFRVDGARVRIVPDVPGRTVDAEATALALADPARTTVRSVVTLLRPSVTGADLAALGIRQRVSAFTTTYEPGQPRVTNIRRASAVIDGTILGPGQAFSMNDVLGERTLAKGYVSAPQIVGSSFSDSVGGGISQVATMLYNGAFFAGLELLEHQPHSLYIDRYPLGREATVSWGGPELSFRNDWEAAVLIDLEAAADEITIQLFSSRLGRRVETETFAPHSHEGGGFTVEYTRRVYRGSSLTRDERFRVRYGVAGLAGAARGR